MKKLIVIILVIGLSFSGCIKSLYSIVGEGDRILDKRIEGVWVTQQAGFNINDIKIETDDPNENIDSLKHDLASYIDSTLYDESKQLWEIYRAADLKWSMKEKNNQSSESYLSVSIDVVPHNSEMPSFKGMKNSDYELVEKDLLDFYVMKTKFSDGGEDDRYKIVQLTQIGSNYYLDISEIIDDEDSAPYSFLYPNISGHTIVKIDFDGDKIKLYEFDADYIESLIKQKRIRLKHEMVNDEIVLTASTEQLRAFLTKYGGDEKLFEEAEEFYTYQES